jgi:methyl-accepting chemotaxis protein
MKKYTEKRRNYYINKRFQGEFIIKFCVLVLLGSLISAVIIYIMTSSTVTTAFVNSKLTIKSTADFIMPAVLLASAVVVVFIGIAAIGITLFTSHRIAGPLYRIEKDLNDISAGRLNIVFQLRTNDEIKPIVASLNEMVNSLKEKIVRIKKSVAELESSVRSSGNADPEEIRKRIAEISRILDKFTV